MKKNLKIFYWLFIIYCILCYFPFMFNGLNQIEPSLFGIPFTVWSIHVLIIAGCYLLYWASKKAWDSFDKGGDE